MGSGRSMSGHLRAPPPPPATSWNQRISENLLLDSVPPRPPQGPGVTTTPRRPSVVLCNIQPQVGTGKRRRTNGCVAPIHPPAGPSPPGVPVQLVPVVRAGAQLGSWFRPLGQDSAWRSHPSTSVAEGTRESFLFLLSSSMVPGWLEAGT
ncbi:unnamed protein product [Rangifer tarandus platyrhynchus]|uniref:Uncharacterized protein n=1 Tax=Rangifer tarandus platyrhynchus TaxID=3082113 RepID=A0ABN8ZCN9_RANTA|nr:unnamed protein product [Rangifer tarandus platyrhynchus]